MGGRVVRKDYPSPARRGRRGIVNNLRWFRKHAGLTQAEIARRSGVTGTTISNIERWINFPKKETQKKIAAVFRVQPDIIFDKSLRPKKQRPLCDALLPPLPSIERKRQMIICRWCGGQIAGLTWDLEKYELIVGKMPRPAKVHSNGLFYHEDCLKEKIRVQAYFPRLPEK